MITVQGSQQSRASDAPSAPAPAPSPSLVFFFFPFFPLFLIFFFFPPVVGLTHTAGSAGSGFLGVGGHWVLQWGWDAPKDTIVGCCWPPSLPVGTGDTLVPKPLFLQGYIYLIFILILFIFI